MHSLTGLVLGLLLALALALLALALALLGRLLHLVRQAGLNAHQLRMSE